jgi:hypothetical protein
LIASPLLLFYYLVDALFVLFYFDLIPFPGLTWSIDCLGRWRRNAWSRLKLQFKATSVSTVNRSMVDLSVWSVRERGGGSAAQPSGSG